MNTNTNNTELTLKFASEDGKQCFLYFLHDVATIHLNENIKGMSPEEADMECDIFPEPLNGWLKVEYANADFDEDTEEEEA